MDEDRQGQVRPADAKLSREQKAGFIFVIVCGLCALVLGGQYLWTHMAAPFAVSYTGPRLVTGSEQQAAEIAKQKKLDTDSDTINDYDELYIYKTSPYLADSDSDGQPDNVEIAAGQDPNCAPNAPCTSKSSEDVDLSTDSPTLDAQGAELAQQQQALDQALQELYTLPTADIRQMLVDSGADQAQVDAMSDDQVQQLYQSYLQNLQQSGEINKLIPPDLQTPSP